MRSLAVEDLDRLYAGHELLNRSAALTSTSNTT